MRVAKSDFVSRALCRGDSRCQASSRTLRISPIVWDRMNHLRRFSLPAPDLAPEPESNFLRFQFLVCAAPGIPINSVQGWPVHLTVPSEASVTERRDRAPA